LKSLKRPQTKFHTNTMRESKVIKWKNSKFIIRSKFIPGPKVSCNTVFFYSSIFYWNYNNRCFYAFARLFAIL